MKFCALLAVSIVPLCAISGPDDRQATDPKSLNSIPNSEAGPISVEDLFFTRNVGGPAWSPDGKSIVLSTNLTGRNNLWKVSATGSWPVQLSQSDDRQSGAVWSPDGKWILYEQDHGGGEIYDLIAIPGAGGQATNLTHTADVSETGPVFSPDGSKVALGWKPKSSPMQDIAVMNWQDKSVRNLTKEQAKDQLWNFAAWSPDGAFIYANRGPVGGSDGDVYRIEVQTGRLENLTAHTGKIIHQASSISSDGKTLLIVTSQTGFENVALLDVASKQITPVTATQWQASPSDFAPKGDSFTYALNRDGQTEVFLSKRGSKESRQLDFPPGLTYLTGTPTAFSPDGKRLIVGHQSSQQPSDLWLYDLESHKPTQLTYSGIADLNPAKLPPAQVVHYKSFDGKVISAFLWMPYNLKRDGTAPGVVLPHGGPTGQTVDYFNRTAAALASRGYVCIAPNVRGSTGYGIAFQEANKKDLGGGDLQDEVFAAQFLTNTGYVDKKKIGITGGSYGGYMTLMAIGKTPDIWAAAVEEYGIINWLTMLEHEDPLLQQYEQSLLGDPVKDRKIYQDDSPITFIKKEKAPLLVLQGDNDIRVPKEEAEQVVSILKAEGRTVDAHYYPNEGHGFAKRENQIDALQRTIDWFDRYLKGSKLAAASSQ